MALAVTPQQKAPPMWGTISREGGKENMMNYINIYLQNNEKMEMVASTESGAFVWVGNTSLFTKEEQAAIKRGREVRTPHGQILVKRASTRNHGRFRLTH